MSNKNHKLRNLDLAQAIVIHGLRFLARSMVLAMVIDIMLLNNTTAELDFAWQNTTCCRQFHVPTLLLSKQIKYRLIVFKIIFENVRMLQIKRNANSETAYIC